MASMAEAFMTDWQSEFFRGRIVAQIEGARLQGNPNPDSVDQMEKFLAQNSSIQLEEFVFKQSKSREDYLSLTAEVVLHMRQCALNPAPSPQDYSQLAPTFEEEEYGQEEPHEEDPGPKSEPTPKDSLANGEHTVNSEHTEGQQS